MGKSKGKFALHSLILSEDIEAVKSLLEKNINVNRQTDNKSTPLHVAASKESLEAIKLLKRYKADPNIQDYHECIPLHLSAETGNAEAVKLLVALGSDLDAQDRYGNTPLHLASYKGHVDVVLQLLESGANPNFLNSSWMTALSIATKNKDSKLVAAIKKAGGKAPKNIKQTIKLAYLSSNIFRKWSIILFVTLLTAITSIATIFTDGELAISIITAILASLGFTMVCLNKPYRRVRNLEAKVFNGKIAQEEVDEFLFGKNNKRDHLLDYIAELTSTEATNDNGKVKNYIKK
jgi:hypothetical protein